MDVRCNVNACENGAHLEFGSAFASFEQGKNITARDIKQFMCRIFISHIATAAPRSRMRILESPLHFNFVQPNNSYGSATGNICI